MVLFKECANVNTHLKIEIFHPRVHAFKCAVSSLELHAVHPALDLQAAAENKSKQKFFSFLLKLMYLFMLMLSNWTKTKRQFPCPW